MGMPTDGKLVLVLDLGTPNAFAQAACMNDIQVSNVRRVNYDWVKAPPYTQCGCGDKECFDIMLRVEDPHDFSCVPKCPKVG